MCLNTTLNSKGKDNDLWHNIYILRFKNPGFKVDKVEWKSAMIKKDRENGVFKT